MTLAEQVASLRRTLNRLITRRLSRRTSRPFTQLLALKAIALEGVRSQAELADRLLVDAPAVSRLVDRLVEDGLVRRRAGVDRRCVRLEVTGEGQSALEVLQEELRWLEEESRRYLTASEASELRRLLELLHEGLLRDHAPPLSDKSSLEG